MSVPSAPTITTITPGNTKLTVYFTEPSSNGSSAISNYAYSINDGTSWINCSPSVTSSPITINILTNGVSYNVKIRAINRSGNSVASNTVAATPYTTPGAPTICNIIPRNCQLYVDFTAPTSTGGNAITNYNYSIDNGITWTLTGTICPIIINGLTNGNTYNVRLQAVNAAGSGLQSSSCLGIPCANPGVPTITKITSVNTSHSIAFTAPISDGGNPITNYEYSIDNGNTWISAGTTTSPILINELINCDINNVQLRAINNAGTSPFWKFCSNITGIKCMFPGIKYNGS
jgi:hypothetical protein